VQYCTALVRNDKMTKVNYMKSLLVIGALAMAGTAHGAAIASLFNTGVDAFGTPLTNGSTELHYILTGVPSGPTSVRVATSANGFPIGPWIGDDSLSAWIGPNSDSSLDGPVGNYDYQTTFDLTGFDPLTASITGLWAMDNNSVDILINGLSISPAAGSGFSSYSAFAINSNFVSGVNTLDFVISNAGGPTGLRVEMAGTADPTGASTPEPATMGILGLGLVGLGLLRRRRARA